MTVKKRRCRDCEPDVNRPAPHQGPRCATHHREAVKAAKKRRHDAYVAKTYGVSRGFYQLLLEAQDGRCAICRKATGRARRLAVDHCHKTGDPRGLLCYHCNRVVGLWGDDPEVFRRAARYLVDPPAAALLLAEDVDPVEYVVDEAS